MNSKKFKELYLDPQKSVDNICQILRISRSSFYRFRAELALPTFKVLIEDSVFLTKQRYLSKKTHLPGALQYDLEITRLLGKLLNCRMEIQFINFNKMINELKYNRANFAVAGITSTKLRRKDICFSHKYIPDDHVGGSIVGKKDKQLYNSLKTKSVLGVQSGTLHQEYANDNLKAHFRIRSYSSHQSMYRSLKEEKLDFLLAHKVHYEDFLQQNSEFEPKTETILYSGSASIAIAPDTNRWESKINLALEQLQSIGVLQAMTKNYAMLQ